MHLWNKTKLKKLNFATSKIASQRYKAILDIMKSFFNILLCSAEGS